MALRNYLLYQIFKTMEKIGLSPAVLFRQLSQEVSKDKDYLNKKFFGGSLKTESFQQLVQDVLSMMKSEGLIGDFTVEFKDSTTNIEVKGCEYLHMAQVAQEKGEKSCPICIIGLAIALSSAMIEDSVYESMDYETDLSSGTCKLEIKRIAK